MSTLQATNLKHGSSASNNLVLDANGNVTAAGTVAMATPFAMRNKIINGAMEIDQRNGGASVSVASGAVAYTVDRNGIFNGGPNAITAQRVSGAAGFRNALQVTGSASNTGVSWYQRIEANNTFDLAGVSVTFSAWVWASGTRNVSPVISTPNSFENFSSQTVGGSTTWSVTTTPTRFSWTFTMPANAVNGAEIAIQLGTILAGQTVTITGVQLEVGSVATPFERRLYPQELAMCQRYYETNNAIWSFNGANTTLSVSLRVTKRAQPTISVSTVGGSAVSVSGGYTGTDAFRVTSGGASDFTWNASAEL